MLKLERREKTPSTSWEHAYEGPSASHRHWRLPIMRAILSFNQFVKIVTQTSELSRERRDIFD
jgi:hypothetical protein